MERKEYIFKEVDQGEPLDAVVWYKPGDSKSGRPIAFYLHGGNFVVGHKDLFSQVYVEKLLDLGFGAVVSPNYRLSPTISAYEGAVTDSKDAYEWAQTKLPKLLSNDANVDLDGDRIATLGHSAGGTLALLMASAAKQPRAILDIFGMKYLSDSSYRAPNPALANMPDFDKEFLDQIDKDVPPPKEAPPPMGPNGPDFSKYRSAWLFNGMKNGTYLQAVQPDGKYDKIDPATLFSSSFPPTYFIHGSADAGVDVKFSQRAHAELQEKGVESRLVVVEGAPHGFDARAKPGDEYFNIVAEGFKFLANHV